MKSPIALCTYRIQQNKDEEFLSLLRQHCPTLRKLGLVTEDASPMFCGKDESGKSFYVEILHWKSSEGPNVAEQMPEVLAIWEKMGKLVEGRLNRPPMEFPLVEEIDRA